MTRFNPSALRAERARQAWVILVGYAMRRQTTTYGDLAELMYRIARGRNKRGGGTLAHTLGRIWDYCLARDLPLLPLLVVNAETGMPGSWPIDHAGGVVRMMAEQSRVFRFDWYDIDVPRVDELGSATLDDVEDEP